MIGALVYLRLCSIRNRVRTRLRRLKQPKYLIGAIVGLVYLWTFFFRNLIGGHFGPRGRDLGAAPPEWEHLFELGGAWVLLVLLSMFWVLPSRRAALDFTEAEVQFLFAAPISRRGLLHYKLLSWQLGLLFTSLMLSLFSGRLLRMDGAWMAILGWWLVLLLIQMHALGASFARTMLLDRGFPHWKRRLAVAVGMVALVGTAIAWNWQALRSLPIPAGWESADTRALSEWLELLSATPPVVWVLTPLQWVSRMMWTRDAREFGLALMPTLGLVALHYVWVIRANVAFEEASVDAARATAERLGAAREGGKSVPVPARWSRSRHVFDLRPVGASWMALGWKNLVAAGALFRGRTLWVLALSLLPMVAVGASLLRGTNVAGVVGFLSLMLLAMSVLMGPAAARFDLRMDLVHSGDVLKSLPLSGWQLVLGELLAPWWILTGIQWGLAVLAAAFLPALPGVEGAGIGVRMVSFGTAAVLAPALSLVGLCLQNAAALLFPAWVLRSPGQPRGGFEVMGQQMIVLAGQIMAFLVALIPPTLAGGIVFAVLAWGFGPWLAVLPAAVAAVVVLLAEAALGIYLLGLLWDRCDLSQEQAP